MYNTNNNSFDNGNKLFNKNFNNIIDFSSELIELIRNRLKTSGKLIKRGLRGCCFGGKDFLL